MGEVRTLLSVMVRNWSVLICFELIYKVIGLCFFFPFFGEFAVFYFGVGSVLIF